MAFCEVKLFRLEIEYYFIHIAAAASLTVPNSIEPIFVHFFECMADASRMLSSKCSIVYGLSAQHFSLTVSHSK